ncbi:hypothetical protein PanWU01x14_015340, partial [Parasponia andersonii]
KVFDYATAFKSCDMLQFNFFFFYCDSYYKVKYKIF